MRRPVPILAALVAAVAAPVAARANPAAYVPTLGTVDFVVDYQYERDSSDVEREQVGGSGTTASSPVGLQRDLVFHEYQHTITPRIDVGIARDTWLSASLPIVVAQSRTLSYDTGVTAQTSSTVADGILPEDGLDAGDPGSPLAAPLAFQSVSRHGLDTLSLGLGAAPMNQRRDDTKPTWKLGVDVLLAVGSVETLTDKTIASDTGVGYGVDSLHAWMSFDRRLGRLEPYATLGYDLPFATTSSSLFQSPGFGATNTLPGQKATATFGIDTLVVDTPDHDRVSIDLAERLVAHFEGRDYSEMWEAIAFSGDAANPKNPLILDGDPTAVKPVPLSNPGITDVENYLELATRLSVRAELGPHVHVAAFGEVKLETDHAITFDNAGILHAGQTVVEPGTAEVNPLFSSLIDVVGHRYISTDGVGVVLGVQGFVNF